MVVEAPMPTAAPKAPDRFIKGNVMAKPEIPIGPTSWPIKALSMML